MNAGRTSRSIAWTFAAAVALGAGQASLSPAAFAGAPAQAARTGAEFRGWRTETFGPVVVASGQDMRIGSTAGPGGVFFRRTIAADASYRLTIAGQAQSGQTTVRLTLGQSPPQWLPAPDGRRVITFTGSQTIEVVVYSDTPYAYTLQALDLEVCERCVQPGEFRGWRLESYGTAEWASDASGATLASSAGAGGVFFRQALDPARTYRLQMAGREVSGGTTVRLTVGNVEPRWFRAPSGTRHLTVSGSDKVEVVVYGDAAHTYRLETLAMEECAACLTDPQLVRLIHAAIPQLQGLLERDRRAAARSLLNWTANVVDLGLGDTVEAATTWAYEMGAAEAYQELWSTGRDGTACGGFADFFSKVLPLFGFDAFTVNFGYAGTPVTHVTTVVAIDNELYILDPTFNGEYVSSRSGESMRLADVLKRPADGVRGYAFRTMPIARDLVFTSDADGSVSRLLSTLGVSIGTCQPTSDRQTGAARRVCHDVPYDDRVLKEQWQEDLDRLRLTWDDDMILNLMRHRVLSLSATRPAVKQQFLDTLTSAGIPFGTP